MTRRAKIEHVSGFTVLLVDDNADYLQATRLLLEREGHHVLTATNGREALSMLPRKRIDLLLLDYFMPGMNGEQVLGELRRIDPYVQVILQTGYASEQPPRELLQRLNIQGYYDKTEGPEQLLLWTTVGLKAAATTHLLFRTRRVLGFTAASSAELHRAALRGEPAKEAIARVSELCVTLFDGAPPHALLATLDAQFELHVRAGTGALSTPGVLREVCEPAVVTALEAGLWGEKVTSSRGTVLPLVMAGQTLGAIYVERIIDEPHARDAFAVLAGQIAVAIQSARIGELAAVDLLTGVQVRSAFDRSLLRELRATFRFGKGIALVLVDVDGLAEINRRGGRLRGDRMLQAVAAGLVKASRAEDLVGRYDGDTFGVIMRHAAPDGAVQWAARLAAELGEGATAFDALTVCVGYAAAPPHPFSAAEVARPLPASYFHSVAELLRATASAALGEAQRAGSGGLRGSVLVNWPAV